MRLSEYGMKADTRDGCDEESWLCRRSDEWESAQVGQRKGLSAGRRGGLQTGNGSTSGEF